MSLVDDCDNVSIQVKGYSKIKERLKVDGYAQ